MKTIIKESYDDMSAEAARIIAVQIIADPESVLGLPTGSTPIKTYKKLVEFYKRGLLDFSSVTTFNLDEYLKLPKHHEKSFHTYMEEKLFSKVNIKAANTHFPDGQADDPKTQCERYEKTIYKQGGIDLMVLGIGTNGHIGFNEPGTSWDSKTRRVKLTEETRRSNFSNIESAPEEAITIGTKTIMQAQKILLLASGESKAKAIRKSLKGQITKEWPASILQLHPKTIILLDSQAARKIIE